MQPAIKQVKFKPGLPLEIEIIPVADTIAKHKEVTTTAHRAEFYHIFWIQKGTAEYLIDFQPVQVKADSFLFVSKDRVQVLDHKSRHDGKLLLFTDNFFAKNEADARFLRSSILFNDFLNIPVISVKEATSAKKVFLEIESELSEEKDQYHYDILRNMLHNLLLLAERERRKQGYTEAAKGADLDYTVLFKDLVEDQFVKTKSVNIYASQMNVSEKRLAQAISKTLGKSPKSVIDERVMLEAKRLLVHTNFAIKEIGYRLGFEEPTNFIKYFRKHAEKTPIEFRECYPNR